MSNWQINALDAWIYHLEQVFKSEHPREALTAFFIDFESDVYNRAISDIVKNIEKLPNPGPLLGKILAMRLSSSSSSFGTSPLSV